MTCGGATDDEELFDLLDDQYARRILVAARDGPRSADALSDACDASPSTIYRRIERLRERDLIAGEQRIDPDGHHYEVYSARLDRVTIDLTEDGFEVTVERYESDPADRFTNLYEELSSG
jgi:predicted transcriptional regulator